MFEGKELRLKQQYFLSSASLTDIVRRYKSSKFAQSKNPRDAIKLMHEKVAIQLNDTHPSISIPGLLNKLVELCCENRNFALKFS